MPFEFDWVDAFSAKPFGGNGCAVVFGGDALQDEVCMSIVRETGLVECTFLGPSAVADIKVRYFLANAEIPFAGHPTIATVASLADRGLVRDGRITLETGAGNIEVTIVEDDSGTPVITMTQMRPQFGSWVDPELVAAVGGIDEQDIIGSPRVVSAGLPFCVTILRDQEALSRVRLNLEALDMFRKIAGAGFDSRVMEPFWVTLSGATEVGDTFSRLLMPPPMPPEDPFTGSATGAMASYLWAEKFLKTPEFVAQQGHWMGRPGQAAVEVLGPREDISGVKVSGQGYVLMRGYLNL
jgi:PhzF family phenazine biosynthesis protein